MSVTIIVDGEPVEISDEEWAAQNPEPAPSEPMPYQIAKADLWRRATEKEAEAMDAALSDAPARLRRAYDAAQYIASDDPWFPELQAGITAAIGAKRAAVILARS